MARARAAQPPPCRRFLRGFAGGISELQPVGSASAGRKLSAWVTSIFLHKQLAANKRLKWRFCKSSAPCAPLTEGGRRGQEGGGRERGPESRGGVCARRFPKTLSPSSEALLKLPTKSWLFSGEVNDRSFPLHGTLFPDLGSVCAARCRQSTQPTRIPDALGDLDPSSELLCGAQPLCIHLPRYN